MPSIDSSKGSNSRKGNEPTNLGESFDLDKLDKQAVDLKKKPSKGSSFKSNASKTIAWIEDIDAEERKKESCWRKFKDKILHKINLGSHIEDAV